MSNKNITRVTFFFPCNALFDNPADRNKKPSAGLSRPRSGFSGSGKTLFSFDFYE
jgi:hypothetical protein